MPADQSLQARFARIVNEVGDEGKLLDRYCEAGQLLLDADGAAITVNYNRPDRHTVSATSAMALMIEDAQDVTGEGPAFDASRRGEVVIGSFGDETNSRWSMLNDSIAGLGFTGSVVAMPIVLSGEPLGVLTAYRLLTSLSFDRTAADFLASTLGVALVENSDPDRLEQELSGEWSQRAVVHQATGMVIAQLRVNAADALVLLRAHAYASDSVLWDVAAQVVERTLTFDNLSIEEDL